MTSSPLIVGPLLRFVDDVSASIWFETRDAGSVSVTIPALNASMQTASEDSHPEPVSSPQNLRERTFRAQTFAVHGHHYALVAVEGLEPGSVTPHTVEIAGTRLIVLDSRTTRALEPRRRALLDESETTWLSERMQGGFRQMLIGTSLPFLLPTGLLGRIPAKLPRCCGDGDGTGRRSTRFGPRHRAVSFG